MKKILILAVFFTSLSCGTLNDYLSSRVPPKEFEITKKWVRNTLSSEYLGYRQLHRMPPLLLDETIIQGNAIDGIGAYDRKTGNERWKVRVSGGVEAGAILRGDYLFFGGSDGQFYSVNATNGELEWVFPVNAETLGAPTFDNGKIYFLGGNNRVYALNAENGKQAWAYSRRETSSITIRGGSQPVVSGDILYVGFSDGYLVALNVNSGQVIWEQSLNDKRRFRDVDSSPIVFGDRIYVSSYDDALYCLERSSGKVLWRHEEGGYSSVQLSGDNLYYSTTSGKVQALDSKSGKLLWTYKPKVGLSTRPQIYRGLVVFGEYEGDLVVLDAQSGKSLGHFSSGRGIMSEPSVDPKTGDLYFISVDANLHAMKLAWRKKTEEWPWD